jgi:hypothetical protein
MKTYPFHPVLTRALFLAVLVLASSSAQAQVLLDGGFESPRLAPNSVQSGAGTVWTVSSGGALIVSNNYENLGVTPYGTQYLSLNARSSVSQTIAGFVTGETYVLGADFADETGDPGQTFTLSISGVANASLTLPVLVTGSEAGYGSGTIPFQSAVIVFQATSNGSATVTLANAPAGGGTNDPLAVDNVALYGDTVPIPEPSTWALFLSCLGLLIWHFGLRRDAAVFRA